MADIVKTLNDLIAVCRDSEEGFGKAAKGCHGDGLQNRLIGTARQRADFVGELTERVHGFQAEPAAQAHESGVLHEGWRQLEKYSPQGRRVVCRRVHCRRGEHSSPSRNRTDTRSAGRNSSHCGPAETGVQEALLELRGLEMLRKAS